MNRIQLLLKMPHRLFARKVKSVTTPKPSITNLYNDFIEAEELEIETKEVEKETNLESESKALAVQQEQSYLDIEKQDFIRKDLLHDEFKPSKHDHTLKITKNLDKNHKWGLVGELLKRKSTGFATDRLPTVDECIEFFTKELLKDIEVFDLKELGKDQMAEWGILATGFSNRHLYKAAKSFVREMEKLDEGLLKNAPKVHGRKDDEWILVCAGRAVHIHLFTENTRRDVALADKWKDQVYCFNDERLIDDIETKIKKHENPFRFRNINN